MTKVVAFTGHREFLNHAYVAGELREAVQRAIHRGFRLFYYGGARGFDLLAAEIVLEAGWKQADVKLHLVKPFADQTKGWSQKDKEQYAYAIAHADAIVEVGGQPNNYKEAAAAYHARNRWMVDHADAVIACWDGRTKGGTYQTIKYAEAQEKPAFVIDPVRKETRWRPVRVRPRKESA